LEQYERPEYVWLIDHKHEERFSSRERSASQHVRDLQDHRHLPDESTVASHKADAFHYVIMREATQDQLLLS
jgi:hypothetical protein